MTSADKRRAMHLCGVGGIGMSALAQVLAGKGCRVSGSDRAYDAGADVPVFNQLRAAGVCMVPQDGSGVTPDTDAVVVSTAIEDDNPDISAARRHETPIRHRSEVLADLANRGRCLAVTGTSGKTTVTALAGWILTELGEDPTVVNGGSVINWMGAETVGNVRLGHSDLWVVEADESDRSLLNFHPRWSIITNVSKDHFELEELQAMFETFAGQTSSEPVTDAVLDRILSGADVTCTANGVAFAYEGVRFSLAMIGAHNVRNALQAILAVERMGRSPADAARALASFRGVHRRLELAGEAHGISVLDDYAHNPAKIAAAWHAVRDFANRVVAVWQPHGYGPLEHMYDELVSGFQDLWREGDRLLVRPVFYAGGTATRSVDSRNLVATLRDRGVDAELIGNEENDLRAAMGGLAGGDVVLSMGARDPLLPDFARRLLAAISGP